MKLKHNSTYIKYLMLQRSILLAILIFAGAWVLLQAFPIRTISPCPENGCFVQTVYAKEIHQPFAEVLIRATKEFESEGPTVLHDMYNVLWCEHRYNQFGTPHVNDNGSADYGPFQINSLWTKIFGTKYQTDLDENIRVAHEIWKRSHSFNAWTCVSKYHVTD